MMERDELDAFVQSWISSWNAHDLDSILAHYADDVVLHSPMIARVTGTDMGWVQGRAALRNYWTRALELAPDLRFDLQAVYWGRDALTILYSNQWGRRASEAFVFTGEKTVSLSIATYEGR